MSSAGGGASAGSAVAISVAVRVRCLNQREIKYKSKNVVEMPDINTLLMHDPRRSDSNPIPPRRFNFDHCLWSFDTNDDDFAGQQKVYDLVGKPALDNSYNGYNGCIFAYGQTGSGKSYSMSGSRDDPGVIPKLCADLFARAAEIQTTHSVAVECSFLEIYNEAVKDLLSPATIDKALKVRQHPKLGVFVEGLKKLQAHTAEDIAAFIDDGTQVRTIAATQMNATSSRSHAILTLNIRVKSTETETMSVLHLVDLAGSERQASTGAEGATLREGANINKSLSVLGMCLARLADQAEGRRGLHVPYRDSQLTWLLHDSLGGNSKTAMLAAISPADINYEETLSTLRFASITKKIKMNVTINEDPQQKIIRELREQIVQIKEDIRTLALGVPPAAPAAATTDEEEEEGDSHVDPMAVDALPEVDVDMRRQQLLEELEENTKLMTDALMTDEQRAAQDAQDRAAHEQQMAELKRGGGAGDSGAGGADETSPKLLVLNEDLRMLRGADGNPLPLVHTMVRPTPTMPGGGMSFAGGGASAGGGGGLVIDDSVAAFMSPTANDPNSSDGSSSAATPEQQRQLRARSTSILTRGRSMSVAPPHSFSIQGPIDIADESFDDADPAAVPAGPCWLRLPAASSLTSAMRLSIVVDYHGHTVVLEFDDGSSSSHNQTNEVVFVNGKPLRTLTRMQQQPLAFFSTSGAAMAVELKHNDRVIIGQVIFRYFEPLAWRVAAAGGEEETFQERPTTLEHLEMLESFARLGIEEDCMTEYIRSVWGDDADALAGTGFGSPMSASRSAGMEDASTPPAAGGGAAASASSAGIASPIAASAASTGSDAQLVEALAMAAVSVQGAVAEWRNTARFGRAETEETLIIEYPRDVRRELRAVDRQDAITFTGAEALGERQAYLHEKHEEEEEMRRKLEASAEAVRRAAAAFEQQQREREAEDRRAREAAESDALARVQEAESERQRLLEQAQSHIGGGNVAPQNVGGITSGSAQSKLAIARRVHEYEELRRDLLQWKPGGPQGARDRALYARFCGAMSGSGSVPTYGELRREFGAENQPRFERDCFKNRIKTGFFSRGGLHPVTLLVIDNYLFYFDAGAGLADKQRNENAKMNGFAYLVGCEILGIQQQIEKKPAIRVVSCSPRKHGQARTDPHHGLEFAFAQWEQVAQATGAIEAVRLPPPDSDVAAALAQLEA